ncbi:hypothetical protein KFE25_003038 [Diacronema lutheri]|uniref:Uncharacterized protein n=1 Tax=Diacronema lutheri TaxID=2081491 RepID=A0A8J5X8D7_DIALT|nr:hypothetical protein KFE25_003038 [Diacronema lutheri]
MSLSALLGALLAVGAPTKNLVSPIAAIGLPRLKIARPTLGFAAAPSHSSFTDDLSLYHRNVSTGVCTRLLLTEMPDFSDIFGGEVVEAPEMLTQLLGALPLSIEHTRAPTATCARGMVWPEARDDRVGMGDFAHSLWLSKTQHVLVFNGGQMTDGCAGPRTSLVQLVFDDATPAKERNMTGTVREVDGKGLALTWLAASSPGCTTAFELRVFLSEYVASDVPLRHPAATVGDEDASSMMADTLIAMWEAQDEMDDEADDADDDEDEDEDDPWRAQAPYLAVSPTGVLTIVHYLAELPAGPPPYAVLSFATFLLAAVALVAAGIATAASCRAQRASPLKQMAPPPAHALGEKLMI